MIRGVQAPWRVVPWLACGVLLAGCAIRPEQINVRCEWVSEQPRLLHIENAAGFSHLQNDVTVAEELAIRYADVERGVRSPHYQGNAEYERTRLRCLAGLFGDIARTHDVEASRVAGLLHTRPWTYDVGVIFVPMLIVAVLVSDAVVRRILRRFSEEERAARIVALVLAAGVVTLALMQVGSMWSFLAEERVRLQTNHLSYRAFYLPWSRHGALVSGAAVLVFGVIALARTRTSSSPPVSNTNG